MRLESEKKLHLQQAQQLREADARIRRQEQEKQARRDMTVCDVESREVELFHRRNDWLQRQADAAKAQLEQVQVRRACTSAAPCTVCAVWAAVSRLSLCRCCSPAIASACCSANGLWTSTRRSRSKS